MTCDVQHAASLSLHHLQLLQLRHSSRQNLQIIVTNPSVTQTQSSHCSEAKCHKNTVRDGLGITLSSLLFTRSCVRAVKSAISGGSSWMLFSCNQSACERAKCYTNAGKLIDMKQSVTQTQCVTALVCTLSSNCLNTSRGTTVIPMPPRSSLPRAAWQVPVRV